MAEAPVIAVTVYFVGAVLITCTFITIGWCLMWKGVLSKLPPIQEIFLKQHKW